MAESVPNNQEMQDQLQTVAKLLRDADHLEPEQQQELADLLTELGHAVDVTHLPATEVDHLVASTHHLQLALRDKETESVHHARDRLEQAMVAFDSQHPMIAGIVRRLIDALSNMGI